MSRNDEANIQAAIFQYVRAVAPDVLIFAVPNGGLRAKAEAARLKWTGVVAGVPDLCLVLPGGRACFIEVKTAKGVLSADQKAMRLRLIRMGVPCVTARSVEDVRAWLQAWGVLTRESKVA